MMHNAKVYFTCDRCGKRFEKSPKNVFLLPIRRKCNVPTTIRLKMVDRNGYIGEEYLITPEVLSATIIEYYKTRNIEYDLYPECRKAFHEFMSIKI